MKLKNYVTGSWIEGDGEGKPLFNSVTGQKIATATTDGLDFNSLLQYGREVGGTALRKMTFFERGMMLKKLALHLVEIKDKYYPISFQTGATKVDSWIDIEGGIGNLFANASLRRQFGNQPFYVDGAHAPLSKEGSFIGHHIMVPKEGVAIHINAYNFPIWGMLEKIAVNLLAGVPAIVKPATVTSFLTEAMVKDIVASGILPEGSLQLLCGSAGDILDYVSPQDVVTFTGSATTGRMLKAHPKILDEAVPFNMEADSLNCSVLGKDATPDTAEFDLFIKEVHREMTVKCGQKCTAIRRIIVPEDLVEDVQIALGQHINKTIIGNPTEKEVKMGALAGKEQLAEVNEKVDELLKSCEIVAGTRETPDVVGADGKAGAFMSPLLLLNHHPFSNEEVHNIEAFGPVSTIIPYKSLDEAIELSKKGKGSLVCSIATANDKTASEFVYGTAAWHGRILILNKESAVESTGHGSPMPMLVHGGPGRAGGGEEMGGARGVKHYLQRTAVQGTPTSLTEVLQQYQPGGKHIISEVHLFQKHFEELQVGETVITDTHTVTLKDIEDFAELSGDKFYAHMDESSLDGTIFTERVAHGYFIMSKAAGLFVDPPKGPVLLNYGIDECRFTKPVYPGTTVHVNFTVQEKIDQDNRGDEDVAKGIVKFMVEVVDDEDETCMMATILTMVKKKDQSM